MPTSPNPRSPLFSRREMLKTLSGGFGYLAFAGLAARAAAAGTVRATCGAARAQGAAFRAAGKARHLSCACAAGRRTSTRSITNPSSRPTRGAPAIRPGTKLLGSKWKFAQHGQSGLWISELFPNVANHADELCLLRSMQTDLPAHPQAFLQMHTGSFQFVRPSLGAWTLYGLGTENENLPGFVTLTPPAASGGAQNYGSSFLPAIYQGTRIGADNRPIAGAEIRNLKSPLNTGGSARRARPAADAQPRDAAARPSSIPTSKG